MADAPPPGSSRDPRLPRQLFGGPEATRWARTMFQTIPVAMTLRDRDANLLWANAAYEELMGRPFEELAGQVPQLKNAGFQPAVVIKATEPQRLDELRYGRPDGSEVVADVVLQPLLDEQGETVYVLAVLTDVTARVEAGHRRALDELLSGIGRRLTAATPDTHTEALEATLADLGRHFDARWAAFTDRSGHHSQHQPPLFWAAGGVADGAVDAEVIDAVDRAPRTADSGVRVERGPDAMVVSVPVPKFARDGGVLCLAVGDGAALSEHETRVLGAVARTLSDAGDRIEALLYFHLAFDDAPVGISIRDLEGVMLTVNQAYADLLGYESPGELIGRPAGDLLAGTTPDLAAGVEGELERPGDVYDREVDLVRTDGRVVTARVRSKLVETVLDLPLILCHAEDITASAENQRQLSLSQRRFAGLVENSPAITMLTDTELEITYVSPSVEQLGWTPDELLGRRLRSLRGAMASELVIELERVLRSRTPSQFEWTADGPAGTRWLTVSAVPEHDEGGNVLGLLMVAVDQSERRRSQAELAFQASHDSLTGLANRAALVAHLDSLRDTDFRPGLLFLDLDRFKVINDSLGHAAGDALLEIVAQRLREAVRSSNLVARLGGDEFVVVIDGSLDEPSLRAVADRIHEALAEPVQLDEHEVHVRASIGIATGSGRDPEKILADADAAMYLAKDLGRNRTEVYRDKLVTFPSQRIDLEADLRQALHRRQLEVWYQPEVDLVTRRVLGAEALLRWRHPTRGIVPARTFVPIAEECGLITEMGDWVLRQAGGVAAQWQADPRTSHLVMRVNLSAHQMTRADAVDRIMALLAGTDVDPGRICLEITETALMAGAQTSIDVLDGLRRIGLRFAIDDFGTGYSSLSYLKRFQINVLKIDRSFVDGIPADANDLAIVDFICSLADSLGLDLVAEGVETEDQARALLDLGCRRGQGYLFGHPVPLEEFSGKHLAASATT